MNHEKRILITGGAGFIGFNIAKKLAVAGHSLVVCDNLSRGRMDREFSEFLRQNKKVSFVNCDLTKEKELRKLKGKFDEVYHLAAIVGVRYAKEFPEKILTVNGRSVLNIADWFVKSGSTKLLFSSTSEVYAGSAKHYELPIPTPENVPLTIDDVFNSRNSYCGSKIFGELLFINFAKTFKFRMSIVRYHNVYGGRMGFEHVIPEFCMRIFKREDPFKVFDLSQTRAFCHIDDCAEATIRVMESDKTDGQVVHVGNDAEEIPVRKLLEKLFVISGFQPKVDELPAPPGSPDRRCPDIRKLRELTGFSPRIGLDEGLRKTYEWYQEYHQKK